MMRPTRRHRRWRARAVVAWATLASLVMIGCRQSSPPPVDTYGEGDTIEHAPGVSGEVKTVTLPGPGGEPFTFSYEIIDGLAIVEGDMIIGEAEDFASLDDADEIEVLPESSVMSRRVCWKFLGITLHCESYRWPSAIMPYTFANDWDDAATAVDENAAMRSTIRAAMDEIEAVSAMRFVPRTSEGDYVQFRKGSGCSATVGHQGGGQNVNLAFACNHRWVIAHEILHALGLHHEQARDDRDGFVVIHWDNIVGDKGHNFERPDFANDVGAYDYDSVMHYAGFDFCRRDTAGACVGPTITTTPPGTAIGQRSHLSTGDVAALARIYPGEAPTLSITSPGPGASYDRRASNVFFEADVDDPEGMDVTVTWTSDVSGVLGTGNPLTVFTGDLAYGTHVVTARGTDPQGHQATDTVTLVVTNSPPTVDLYLPLPGDFCVGESITFRATVIDLNELGATLPDARVAWRVGTGSTFATGKTVTRSFPSAGDRQVVVRATDELGLYAEDWVWIGIDACSNLPPTVAITTPSADVERVYDGYDTGRGMWYADLALVGAASDPEDGALGGASLVWTTDQSGLQGAVLGTGTSLTARLYSDTCTGVTHTITLTATDADGHARTAIVRIRIWTIC